MWNWNWSFSLKSKRTNSSREREERPKSLSIFHLDESKGKYLWRREGGVCVCVVCGAGEMKSNEEMKWNLLSNTAKGKAAEPKQKETSSTNSGGYDSLRDGSVTRTIWGISRYLKLFKEKCDQIFIYFNLFDTNISILLSKVHAKINNHQLLYFSFNKK